MACPDCKKKVVEEHNGYRCESCAKLHQKANPTYNFSARISDYSGTAIASFLGDIGDEIMGISASEFKTLKEKTGNSEEIKE